MTCSLLIVDDDPSQLEMLSASFVRAEYRVVSAHDPRQALEAASFQQFQVALLDASLPEMDGLELMRRLKRPQDGVQIVILSGYEHPIWQAKAEDAFTWLVKPCKDDAAASYSPAGVRMCEGRATGVGATDHHR